MPTKNPRLLITLEPSLYQWVKRTAETQGISMSLFLRDLVKKEYQEEAWYWTESWQAGECEADEDLRRGRYKDFDTVEEMIEDLKS